MKTTSITFFSENMKGIKLIINGGDEVIHLYTTENPDIYVSNYLDKYLNTKYLLIMYLFDTDYERVCLVNHARKILEELKYFSAEKLAFLEKLPKYQGKRAILFRYSFKYTCGIDPAIDMLIMEKFYAKDE